MNIYSNKSIMPGQEFFYRAGIKRNIVILAANEKIAQPVDITKNVFYKEATAVYGNVDMLFFSDYNKVKMVLCPFVRKMPMPKNIGLFGHNRFGCYSIGNLYKNSYLNIHKYSSSKCECHDLILCDEGTIIKVLSYKERTAPYYVLFDGTNFVEFHDLVKVKELQEKNEIFEKSIIVYMHEELSKYGIYPITEKGIQVAQKTIETIKKRRFAVLSDIMWLLKAADEGHLHFIRQNSLAFI